MNALRRSSRRLVNGVCVFAVLSSLALPSAAQPVHDAEPWWKLLLLRWLAVEVEDGNRNRTEATASGSSAHEKAGPHGDPWGDPNAATTGEEDPNGGPH